MLGELVYRKKIPDTTRPTKRARVDLPLVRPFSDLFLSLSRDLQLTVYRFATRDFRIAANRIRLAYRLFRRRVQSTVGFFTYTPSAQALMLGDTEPRVVRMIVLD